jgi:bacterioferritin (cytochrome b1)
MQGDPNVKAGLQRLVAALLDLMCQYMLDAINTKRLGLSIGDGLDELCGQCGTDLKDLVKWLYFLEAQPEIGAAKAHATVAQVLTDATTAETAFVAAVNQLADVALKAGDMAVFHGLQHLAKFHTIGGGVVGSTDRTGRIAWLQKQDWQVREFGEKDYEATKA